jgi:ABC-type lipoprotein release transport system permease subunit
MAGAWFTSSLLQNLIVGVRATDPRVFIVTAVFFALVAFTACIVPALRAMRVDPNVAFRAQ